MSECPAYSSRGPYSYAVETLGGELPHGALERVSVTWSSSASPATVNEIAKYSAERGVGDQARHRADERERNREPVDDGTDDRGTPGAPSTLDAHVRREQRRDADEVRPQRDERQADQRHVDAVDGGGDVGVVPFRM